MKINIDKKYGLNLDGVSVDTWKLLLIRYLLLGETDFDTEFIKYENTTAISADFLNYFLGLCSDFGIKITRVGFSDYAPIPYEQKTKIRSFLEKNTNKLFNKTLEGKLSLKELYKLMETDFEYKRDILDNLTFYAEYSNESKRKLQEILDFYTSKFMAGKLHSRDAETHQHYSYLYQRSCFLNKISETIQKYGHVFQVSEQQDIKLLGEDPQKITFFEVFLSLEREGYLKITDIEIRNSSRFKLKNPTRQDLVIHIELTEKSTPKPSGISPITSKTVLPPLNWDLVVSETKANITKDGHVVFPFPSNTSNRFRYFKCLWDHYGQRVPYPQAYEYQSKLEYPHKRGKNHLKNSQMRNTIRKLRKEFEKKELPIKIVTNRGFILTIEE